MNKIYIMLLLVMMAWGFNVAAIKVLVTNIDPILLTSARIFAAGIGVLITLQFMKILRLPTKKEVLLIFYISFFNVVIHHGLMAMGLTLTTGVNAGVIVGLGPLLTMILSTLLLSRHITMFKAFGFFLGFAGVMMTTLLGSGGLGSVSIGDLYIFLSIAAQAFSFILISKLNPDLDPRLLTGYMMVGGSVVIFIASLSLESRPEQLIQLWDPKLGMIFLFSAFICTAFGHMIYNFAIKQVGPAETAIFINFNSFFALLGSVLFLGEFIKWYHIAGLVLIVSGVIIGTGALEYIISRKKRTKVA
ncbi:DMT family transporter [Halobacillus massiliensis]|uniref:DMT family transporter n=1 Tax=Halobacillus massiliensis TaxID=1926286 RepID=UPI0009E252FC|nr:DMT family transporter [Halobacillus massiliensis]